MSCWPGPAPHAALEPGTSGSLGPSLSQLTVQPAGGTHSPALCWKYVQSFAKDSAGISLPVFTVS